MTSCIWQEEFLCDNVFSVIPQFSPKCFGIGVIVSGSPNTVDGFAQIMLQIVVNIKYK